MRSIRRRNHDQPTNPLGMPLAKCQCHHATVGSAHNGGDARELEVIEQAAEGFSLIVTGQAGRLGPSDRASGFTAPAQIVHTEYAAATRVQCPTGTDNFMPPALSLVFSVKDLSVCRDAAEHDHNRQTRRARQSPGQLCATQFAAVMQAERVRERENAIDGCALLSTRQVNAAVTHVPPDSGTGFTDSTDNTCCRGEACRVTTGETRGRIPDTRSSAGLRRRSWHHFGDPMVAPASKGLSLSRSR